MKDEYELMQEFLDKNACPACNEKRCTLTGTVYYINPAGYEFKCGNCHYIGDVGYSRLTHWPCDKDQGDVVAKMISEGQDWRSWLRSQGVEPDLGEIKFKR